MRTHWSSELIDHQLREIVSKDGKMPSVARLKALGRNDLSCAITKRGGFVFWAEKIGAVREASDSDFGWVCERAVKAALKSRGFIVTDSAGVRAPFDMLVDGLVKVDVKGAKFASYGISKGWFYRIGKTVQADIVILHQYDTGVSYILPWKKVTTSSITITPTGKTYSAFKDNYEVLRLAVSSARIFESNVSELINNKAAA